MGKPDENRPLLRHGRDSEVNNTPVFKKKTELFK